MKTAEELAVGDGGWSVSFVGLYVVVLAVFGLRIAAGHGATPIPQTDQPFLVGCEVSSAPGVVKN